MNRTISQTALWLSAAAALAAIWGPGVWWQWLATSAVLVVIGAATSDS